MTPSPGASDPKPTFQDLVVPWATVQYFKFTRGPGAPRVPRAAARCALLLLLLLLLALLLALLLLALLLLAARCCALRAPARLPACPPARRQPAADLQRASAAAAARQRAQYQPPKQVDSAAALTPVGPAGRPPGFRLAVVGARAICAPWGPTLGRRCAPESLREAAGLMISPVKRS